MRTFHVLPANWTTSNGTSIFKRLKQTEATDLHENKMPSSTGYVIVLIGIHAMLCLAKIYSNTIPHLGPHPLRQESRIKLRNFVMTKKWLWTKLQEDGLKREIKINNKRVKGRKSMQYARETGLLIWTWISTFHHRNIPQYTSKFQHSKSTTT